jgi:hypothetical protein
MQRITYTPTPAALAREVERLRVVARLEWAGGDIRASDRAQRRARAIERELMQ